MHGSGLCRGTPLRASRIKEKGVPQAALPITLKLKSRRFGQRLFLGLATAGEQAGCCGAEKQH
ncbi:MAG: hypothetical protein ACK5SM_07985, partial [Sphingomonadales bacterium]